MRRHAVIFVLVLFASALFQAWFLGLKPGGKQSEDGKKLSSLYTYALAHGHSYLPDKPDPQHPILDTSLYHDRHYLYFGIVPFATFMVPWFKLTGVIPTPGAAILLFCIMGYAAYGGVLLLAIRRWRPTLSILLSGTAFMVLIIASGTWPLMGRPAIYEIENAAAYAFLALAFLSLALAELQLRRPNLCLICAAGFAALTIGCRPNYFPAVTIIAFFIAWRSLNSRNGARGRVRRMLVTMTPFVVIGGALALWNYDRFDNPLDFGLKHTVSEDPALVRPLASLAYFPYGVHRYALGAAHLIRYFPFIQGQSEGSVHPAPGQEVSNQVYGFLLISPALLYGLILLQRGKSRLLRGHGAFEVVLLGVFLGNLGFLACVTMSCYRYPADFLGPLALLAALGVLSVATLDSTLIRISLGTLLVPVALWSACALIFQVFSTAQTAELFDMERPADFAAAAKPFNHAVYLYESLMGDGPRGIDVTVKLPGERYGAVEPLVVLGDAGAEDFLYVQYVKPGVIRIGFESTGRGGLLSHYTSVDYAKPHRLKLRYGSFLPPDDHSMLAGLSPSDAALARRMITVRLDGDIILDGWADFHLPRGNVRIGESPDNAAFGSKFAGTIIAVASPLLPMEASPSRWERSSYGPITLAMSLVPMPPGVSDPVLSMGYAQQGGQLLLEHRCGSTVRFIWIDTAGDRIVGREFDWPSNELRKVNVAAGNLFPPQTSSLWPAGTSMRERAQLGTAVTVSVAGEQLLAGSEGAAPASPTSIAIGKDTLYLAGNVEPAFGGSIKMTGRTPKKDALPW